MASKFFTRFSPPPSPTVVAVGGLTQQHFKAECDLNTILRRYLKTGLPPPASPAVYADLTAAPTSLAEAFERVQFAQDWFDGLPSETRLRFANDPRNALRLLMSNPTEAVKLGLIGASTRVSGEANHSQAAEAAKPEPPTNEGGKASAASVAQSSAAQPAAQPSAAQA